MIEAIRVIGEYAVRKNGNSIDNPLEILVDSPKNRYTENVLFIVFESKNGEFAYKDIDIEQYSESKLKKYLYKKGSPRGTDMTPTAMVTSIENTFNQKIFSWFTGYNKIGSNENINFLVKMGNCIRKNKDEILEDLKNKQSKESNIISLKINGKYIGEYEIFKEILLKEAKKNFYSKYGKVSKSDNKVCSVCNKQKAEVYGFVDTYKFYTVDKPGFVSGGFKQKDAWKNYPVCLECALMLKAGKKYLGNSLNFNFYGFKYLLIPKFIMMVDEDVRKDVFKRIEEQKDPKFKRKEINRLTSDENEMLEILSEQKNYLNLNFLFYDAPKGYDGSVFNVLLYIEDVLPSRLKALFKARKEIDEIDIFKGCLVPIYSKDKKKGKREKIGEMSLEFNFNTLPFKFQFENRRIGEKNTINDKEIYKFQDNRLVEHRKYFLDIVNKIFTNKPINYHFLMSFIIRKIRAEFVNSYPTKISTLKGFMLLNYLNKLGILGNFKEVKRMPEDKNSILVDSSNKRGGKVNLFFNKFTDFFNNDAKKAVFLEGVLAQKLLNIQRLPDVSNAQPGKEPFRPRLKGLKLDEKQVKKLLLEAQNKLDEYGKNYYGKLESIISGYLVSSGDNWKMTNDEISYYFVLGMNLAYLFKSENKEEKEGKENE